MKHIHHILYCLLFIAGLSSCIADTILEDPDNGQAKAENAQVMLSLSVPESQLPSATRSISDDSNVNSLHVLVFEGEKEDTDPKNYRLTDVIDIKDKYLNAKDKPFYIAIKESKKVVCLSLVANAEITSPLNSTKGETLESLKFNASKLSYMPMYGEAAPFMDGLSRDVHYNDIKVSLTRALAKIEVQYNSSQTTNEFEFLGIEILNTNDQGYIATGQGILSQKAIGSINIPAGGEKVVSAYVAETENNTGNKISVLVHGKYYDTEGYYRLDMIKEKENNEILRLVRNYKYIFSLQNVNYAGRTRDDALRGEPDNKAFNARVMTLSADESSILDITTDDQYFLGVNSSTLQLEDDGNICFTKLKILTNNYNEGWKIVDTPSDVTFNPGTTGGTAVSDATRKVSTVWIYIDRNQVTKDFNFYITSGKIRKTITVKQPK